MTSTTGIANDAWEALFRAQAPIARELTAGDVWGDLIPHEYGVLYALSKAPDGLRITDLGEDVLLTQPGMSRMIARLEARGLVERRAHESDRRTYALHLTDKGKATMETISRVAREHRQDLLAALSAEEQATLSALLQRVAEQQGLLRGVHPGYARIGRPEKDSRQ